MLPRMRGSPLNARSSSCSRRRRRWMSSRSDGISESYTDNQIPGQASSFPLGNLPPSLVRDIVQLWKRRAELWLDAHQAASVRHARAGHRQRRRRAREGRRLLRQRGRLALRRTRGRRATFTEAFRAVALQCSFAPGLALLAPIFPQDSRVRPRAPRRPAIPRGLRARAISMGIPACVSYWIFFPCRADPRWALS